MTAVPVVALTGFLGAGKTTLLNHVLSRPGARVGVVVNDFGAVNVDAALISGQVDEPFSIAGGCLCCLLDDDRLDQALEKLTQPSLGLDAVIVEASGVAEPEVLAGMIRFSGAERVRPGGLVEVVDAVEYFHTVDDGDLLPNRFTAASVVVINKSDRLPDAERAATLARIERRIRSVNRDALVLPTAHGRIDPQLLFDAASTEDPADQLPFAAARRHENRQCRSSHHEHPHHDAATAATAQSIGPVSAGRLIDLLEEPPPGAYRLKGRVAVSTGRGLRRYAVNLVGRSVHIASIPPPPRTAVPADSELVAIGIGKAMDAGTALSQLEQALRPVTRTDAAGYRRLQRYRRLSQ